MQTFFEREVKPHVMAAILWKKLRRGDRTRQDADDILNDLVGLGTITRHSSGPLVLSAFDILDRAGRTVYDCLYIALAVQLGGQMVTADAKLVNSLAATPWAASLLRLQDAP